MKAVSNSAARKKGKVRMLNGVRGEVKEEE